ncbi:MAG: galactose mutarotase [Oscillospiraceae bacterium]|jgi:aldose 1-epimerase|nr:galactose mutarotase [Oscillospiraceae bacterium]
MRQELFGRLPDGRAVQAVTLEHKRLCAQILTYGATLRSLWLPDRAGRRADVLLGFDSLEEQLAASAYQGEVVGRYANRIAGAKFPLNGREYAVTANEKDSTCLHGGGEFSRALWELAALSAKKVTLRYHSPDGAEGFPGSVTTCVSYTLLEDRLRISYRAVSSADTVLSLTNHAYFNLAGGGDILGHLLQINSEAWLPIDAQSIPAGEPRPVEGSAFDFRIPKPIGRDIAAADPQLLQCGGYDHNYCLPQPRDLESPCAIAADPLSGRTLRVYTDQPGVQLYTGNFLDSVGKQGLRQTRHSGFCLETQAWPNSPNRPDFPSCLLRGGEEYNSVTELVFGAE